MMYYTNGNYEAFAKPRKPKGVDEKQAWLVGGGLASLAAAAFLVRDGQMPGNRIHILEEAELPGGACDGLFRPETVSYTHLDVYKRQVLYALASSFFSRRLREKGIDEEGNPLPPDPES